MLDHESLPFDELYAKYQREVWAVAYARWLDAHSAMDIMQETFFRYWKTIENGEVIRNPHAWLMKVARNLAEDYAKSAFRRHGTQTPELLNSVSQTEQTPIEQIEQSEVFEQLRGLLTEMATADREILTLRYGMEYDTDKIAQTLGIAPTAVHMRLSRARRRLAEQFHLIGVRPGDD